MIGTNWRVRAVDGSTVLQFQMLGSLRVRDDQLQVEVRGRRQRLVLAALLLEANRTVPLRRLVEAVWGMTAPSTATAQIRDRIRRLRQTLALCPSVPDPTAVLMTSAAGYRLCVATGATDLERFDGLAGAGRAALESGRYHEAGELLRSALAMWDVPFGGLEADWLRGWVDGIDERHLGVQEDCLEADLRAGRHREVIERLNSLVPAHPLRERLRVLQVTALAEAGRTAEALAGYEQARQTLAEQLGVDPGPQLQQVYLKVLRGEVSDAAAADDTAPAAAATRTPPAAQLPADIASFAGRRAELAMLDALLRDSAEQLPGSTVSTAVVIATVSGTAGVGKSALAIHWAHRVADRFPDGQLYVNLRGYGPAGQALDPGAVIRGFLHTLGVPPDRVPPDLDAQAGLYRTVLAGKRVLVVLDNARDAEQVRPLLPATPTAFALVTSRNQLAGLIAAEGARPVPLSVLSTVEARELLVRRLGEPRVVAEATAVEQIVVRSARLPLALAIAAARAEQTRFTLTAIAAELERAETRLDVLDTGDATSQLRAVFSWSYEQLSADAAGLFRLLGLHLGPDISLLAAASLTAHTPQRARILLAELTRSNLLVEHAPARYGCHDLLRAYATELTNRADTEVLRRDAVERLLDHYLHTADAANRCLEPSREPIAISPARPGVSAEPVRGQQQALDWFAIERAPLLAAVELAAAGGFDRHVWQLAGALADVLDRGGFWHESARVHRLAVAATTRSAEPAEQARAHRLLAVAYTSLHELPDAHRELGQALALYRSIGDRVGQADAHTNLAQALEGQGRYAEALRHITQALEQHRAAGHVRGEASALNTMGYYQALLGEYRAALIPCTAALELHREVDNRIGEASTWHSLGYAHHHLGDHADAVGCYRHALRLFRDLGVQYQQAVTLSDLGDAEHAGGDAAAAVQSWRQAAAIMRALGHPDVRQVEAKLTGSSSTADRRSSTTGR